MMMLFSLILSPPASALSHSSLSLFLSAVASQDLAIVADRRRVRSINRYWTNYKADVPLYDGGRTLTEGGLSVVLSELLLSVVLLFISKFAFDCLLSQTPSGFLPSLCHHGAFFNQTPSSLPFFLKHQAFFSILLLSTS